ncbi:Basic leucine zipper and W2 domain-containing protein 1, partial [Stegodyphus mimosarum]
MKKYSLPEPEVAVLLWTSLMTMMEWNKKEEMVPEQAVKHLRQYTSLLSA